MAGECARLRVVEFYAGVGGFHHSLIRASAPAQIVASIDINTNTSAIYGHNFPSTPHLNRNICGLSASELDRLSPDVFFLSPPCQPFTRQGLRRDDSDRRTDSFFHLMTLMTEMKHLPQLVLMENVQGFESSNTREHFVGILSSLGFVFQEFLLSPAQFGVPNSRLRYYLLAKRNPLQFSINILEQPCRNVQALLRYAPALIQSPSGLGGACDEATGGSERDCTAGTGELTQLSPPSVNSVESSCLLDQSGVGTASMEPSPPPLSSPSLPVAPPPSTLTVSCFLQQLSDDKLQKSLVPIKILQKYAIGLDIVHPSVQHSCCFTKAYGSYAVGTGSVLQHKEDEDLDEAFRVFSARQKEGKFEESVQALLPLKLRYFTPKEVANLMCFPPSFCFPPSLTDRQCYKAMGNSLNVHVVSTLMKYLFDN